MRFNSNFFNRTRRKNCLPVKYSTWWFMNFVFFVGTFFFIHFAISYSSFVGFSASTSPGPVYSCNKWNHNEYHFCCCFGYHVRCTTNIVNQFINKKNWRWHETAWDKHSVAESNRYNIYYVVHIERRWHIPIECMYSMRVSVSASVCACATKIQFDPHAHWHRPHTKFNT